jgi:hypothetical protein
MIAVVEPVPAPGVGHVLRRAVRDFYEESWRLVLLNSLLSAYVLAVLAVAVEVPAALVLLLGAGPLAAALVSAAVIVVETGSLTFLEVFGGLRRCWLRGLVLAGSLAVAALATVLAFRFYGDAGAFAWPLAVLVLYLGGIFALYQLVLWPLAIRDCERPLPDAATEAGLVLVRRPAAVVGLGLALLVVNVVGIIAAVLPFLTMTIAYSALAAARFALRAIPAQAPAEPAPTPPPLDEV